MDWQTFGQGAFNKFLDFIFRKKSFSVLLVRLGAFGLAGLVTPWWIIEGVLTKNDLIEPQPAWPQVLVAAVFTGLLLTGIGIHVWERLHGITHADASLEAARGVLITYLARSYSSLFNACNWTISTEYEKDSPGEKRYERKVYFIVEAMNDLQRLREKLATDRSVPDAELSGKFVLFQEHAESIIRKLRFFRRTYTESGMSQQLVGYSPVPELFAIEEMVESLKKRYMTCFTREGVVFSGVLPASKLADIWEQAAIERGLCLAANKFERFEGRQLVVYDKTVFRKLVGIKDGEVVQLWNEDEAL